MKRIIRYIVFVVVLFVGLNGRAEVLSDTIKVDSTMVLVADSLLGDTLKLDRYHKYIHGWHPDSKKAMWLGLVLPGGGQIYNRKYWKLPVFYGGVMGCVYALTWNGQMLRDYSQAYQDLVDDDPTTKSYEEMLPIGYDITGREEKLKTMFHDKKDFYRRYRDLSIFCIVAVYALSIIDAYVDAELSTFDISRNLTLHWQPTFIRGGGSTTMLGSPGLSLSVTY